MSRPIDDNWHCIDGKTVYMIPYTKILNCDTEEEKSEEDRLCLCEDCFEALMEFLKEKVDA